MNKRSTLRRSLFDDASFPTSSALPSKLSPSGVQNILRISLDYIDVGNEGMMDDCGAESASLAQTPIDQHDHRLVNVRPRYGSPAPTLGDLRGGQVEGFARDDGW